MAPHTPTHIHDCGRWKVEAQGHGTWLQMDAEAPVGHLPAGPCVVRRCTLGACAGPHKPLVQFPRIAPEASDTT